jgi:hypothetical protein
MSDVVVVQAPANTVTVVEQQDGRVTVTQEQPESRVVQVGLQGPPGAELPVGFVYLQFPDAPSPLSLGLVGVWDDISADYAGQSLVVAGE